MGAQWAKSSGPLGPDAPQRPPVAVSRGAELGGPEPRRGQPSHAFLDADAQGGTQIGQVSFRGEQGCDGRGTGPRQPEPGLPHQMCGGRYGDLQLGQVLVQQVDPPGRSDRRNNIGIGELVSGQPRHRVRAVRGSADVICRRLAQPAHGAHRPPPQVGRLVADGTTQQCDDVVQVVTRQQHLHHLPGPTFVGGRHGAQQLTGRVLSALPVEVAKLSQLRCTGPQPDVARHEVRSHRCCPPGFQPATIPTLRSGQA